jgi:hypothetical protein
VRALIPILVIISIVYLARYLWQKKGYTSRQINQKLLFYAVVGALLILVLSGRLPWLLGLIGAAIMAMGRLLPLLRYAPFLHGLYQRHQSGQNGSSASAGGHTSGVQSRFLRMILDLDSGVMDGEILSGSCQGSRLSELPVETLVGLLSEFSDDRDSLSLLQAYLDRVHNGWQEQAGFSQGNSRQNSDYGGTAGQMSMREAYEVLGLQPPVSRQQIIAAHRRLMQKFHPDRGGSSYLAAKINNAKDVLLKGLD